MEQWVLFSSLSTSNFQSFMLKTVFVTDSRWGGRRCSQLIFQPELMQSEGATRRYRGIGCRSALDRNQGGILSGRRTPPASACLIIYPWSIICLYPTYLSICTYCLPITYLYVIYSSSILFISHLLFTYHLTIAIVYLSYLPVLY